MHNKDMNIEDVTYFPRQFFYMLQKYKIHIVIAESADYEKCCLLSIKKQIRHSDNLLYKQTITEILPKMWSGSE